MAGLLLRAPAYGFHRDELYFILAGRHLDFGYVDQPLLTPLLSALAVSVFGLQPLALRILPALAAGSCVLITAMLARDGRAMSAQPTPQPRRADPVMRLSPPPEAGPTARRIGSRNPTTSDAATTRS